MTVVTAAHGTPNGSLLLQLCLTENLIAQSEAAALAERVKGETGKQMLFVLISFMPWKDSCSFG